jgi:hypothetical protein
MAVEEPIVACVELKAQRVWQSRRCILHFGGDILEQSLQGTLETGKISCVSGDKNTGKSLVGGKSGDNPLC